MVYSNIYEDYFHAPCSFRASLLRTLKRKALVRQLAFSRIVSLKFRRTHIPAKTGNVSALAVSFFMHREGPNGIASKSNSLTLFLERQLSCIAKTFLDSCKAAW
jgi:hypothetical protein